MKENTSGGPVFIVGFPRSGTTLMRALLSAHPTVAIAPETHFLNNFAKGVDGLDLKTSEGFEVFWSKFSRSGRFVDLGIDADSVRRRVLATADFHLRNVFAATLQEFARMAGKPRWGEKTPAHDRHVGTLLEWFADARVIYMVRDPRAACASLLQAPWRIDPDSIGEGIKAGRMRRLQVVDEDSFFWRRSVERYQQDWQLDSRVKLVRYEDLANRPEEELSAVCRFIGADYQPQMLDTRSSESLPPPRAHWGSKEQKEWRQAHIEKARHDVSTKSVAKWKNELTSLEVAIIESNCHPRMPDFGYQLGTPDDSPVRRLRSRLVRTFASAILGTRKAFARGMA